MCVRGRSQHIWVIVEYCTGGDLLSLLKQDKALPESSVKTFGRDIMAGLQYVLPCFPRERPQPAHVVLCAAGTFTRAGSFTRT